MLRPLLLLALLLWASVAHAQSRGTFNVLDFGAIPDGETVNTASIRRAIEACTAAGGGTVYFPAGRYVSGSIHLESNLTLHLDQGATLLYSGNAADSPLVETRWEGTSAYTHGPLIYANRKENIAIIGRGTIDGQGRNWWWRNTEDPARSAIAAKGRDAWRALLPRIQSGETAPSAEVFAEAAHFLRPSLIVPYECKNVLIEGITITNSPMWLLHPIYCENVVVRGVSFISHGPNGDGIDVDSCRNVRISDCFFNTEDDCIVLKSGRDADGRRIGRPTEFVTITNCVMYRGHGAVVIGSEMSGGVRNVTASNIVCYGTDRGIRFKTARGRGAVVENIRFDNWVIENSSDEAIHLTSNYQRLPEESKSERTPVLRNIAISNITVRNAQRVIGIHGLPEQRIEGLRFTDINGTGQTGFVCDLATDLELHDVRIEAASGPAFHFSRSDQLHLDHLSSPGASSEATVILDRVTDAWLRGSRAHPGTETFLEVRGADSRGIVLSDNDLSAAARPLMQAPEVPEQAVIVR